MFSEFLPINSKPSGRIVFQLFDDTVPKTSRNFRELATGQHGNTTTVTRLSDTSSGQRYAQSTLNKKPRLVKKEDVVQSSNHAEKMSLDRSRARCDDREFPAIQRVTCTAQKISKTKVEKCYMLKEKDLIGLERETRSVRFWQPPDIPQNVWAPIYLYREYEIERVAWKKFGGYHGFLKA
uniref:PPIase cyclophilin-type domain-containing protein n=1 Tax=Psilocybe cubensis TaxID=181762 RepID=A0A8H7XXM7_PSICU